MIMVSYLDNILYQKFCIIFGDINYSLFMIYIKAMRQAKEEEQADIEEFDENNIDKGDDTVR